MVAVELGWNSTDETAPNIAKKAKKKISPNLEQSKQFFGNQLKRSKQFKSGKNANPLNVFIGLFDNSIHQTAIIISYFVYDAFMNPAIASNKNKIY